MENTVSFIADICGILAFIISLFVANTVYRIKKQVTNSNNNSLNVSGTTSIRGDFTGRDKKS
jgi:hypothetical protein